MKVVNITLRWAPAPVPEVGDSIDWFKVKGQLLHGGSLVADLPEVEVILQTGPEATRPSEVAPWTFQAAINADTLVLEMYDSEVNHSALVEGAMVGGQEIMLDQPTHDSWQQYQFTLPSDANEQMLNSIMMGVMAMAMVGMMAKAA